MKIIVNKAEFQKSITKIEGIISSRELKSQLSNILFEADHDTLKLTATDLEVFLKTIIECNVHEPGEITLPARKISQITKTIRGDEVELSSNESFETVILDKSGVSNARFAILGLPKSEFPTIPKIDEESLIEFPNSIFLDMLKQTSYAIAEEDSRFVFNGLYLVSEGPNVTLVATDGKRMSKIEREFSTELLFKDGIIIPFKAIREIQKILDSGGNAKLALIGNQLFIQCGDVELLCNLIEGQFPNYNQVIPKEFGFEAVIDREALFNSIKSVSVLANEQSKQIRFSFDKNKLTIVAHTPEVGEADDYLSCEYDGDALNIGFNFSYILDAIQNIPDEKLKLGINSETAPLVIQNNNDDNFVAVIMPMKL
jgi:DNA polymerase-3 subunit beta